MGAALVLASWLAWGCRDATSDEGTPAPAPTAAALPVIVLDEALGISSGTPVIARGITIGAVESTRLEQQHVIVTVRLDAGHVPALGEGACVRLVSEAETATIELVLGQGEAGPPRLERCAGPVELAAVEPTHEPALPPPQPPDPLEPKPEPAAEPKPASKPKQPKRSCGEDLSFATLSVTELDAVPLHLPNGGWRAKIRFSNDGDGFVEIDGVSSAAFIDESGSTLDVASMPGSRDWFMPFQLPPRASKEVQVTLHHDGGPKPWVQRIKYSWSCG